jgi:hypothetical protein
MNQTKRILIALVILISMAGLIFVIEALRGNSAAQAIDTALEPGNIPIYQDGYLLAVIKPGDLETMSLATFVDAEEGKTQDGWLLRDILKKHISASTLDNNSWIIVSSSSRNKQVQLTWKEVNDPANMVMFDLSGRGTLKLVSLLEQLDIRDEWIQDVDKIELVEP